MISETFAGIPYAKPPVGDLRLRPPQPLTEKVEDHDGKGIAAGCPQMYISYDSKKVLGHLLGGIEQLPIFKEINGREDCLTVTVQRPLGTKASDKLPVLFWIYGGGYQIGATNTYDAETLLATAVAQDQPFIYVAVNYRITGFGFLGGKEIKADGSSNLGLLDQRLAMEWVADNIEAFGGDPDRVTLWGESGGAISVFHQMQLFGGNATYNGKPLFRSGIMNSGSALPVDPVDGTKAQDVYDRVVSHAGCSGADDSLQCLRQLPYKTFYDAVNSLPGLFSYNSLNLAYIPRPDGTVLPDTSHKVIDSGRIHAVPIIVGDQEDEGTLFSLFQNNITTSEKLYSYFKDLIFPTLSIEPIKELVDSYPDDPSEGSPFRTGTLNQLYPGFKRVAAVLGDISFILTRRLTLEDYTNKFPGVPCWSYLSSYDHALPFLGTLHASDLLQTFYGVPPNYAATSTRTYYLNFLYNMDPNKGVKKGSETWWPKWTENRMLMWFKDASSTELTKDDFRASNAAVLRKYIDLFNL